LHSQPDSEIFDLLRVPVLGKMLHWRHARTALQVPMLAVALAMIFHGLLGPRLAPKNLATTLSWVHFRGALVLILLVSGNFFCMSCPFVLVRDWVRRIVAPPRYNWPRRLRNKFLPTALFVLILFVYELFSLWSSPWWTAWLIVGYFLAIVAVDGIFKHGTFCKFVCPIGQFNFVASMLSPLEVKVRDHGVCDACQTKDCIRGRRQEGTESIKLQRGCELALFQPLKVGNLDCTFCLDCLQACPQDNIVILGRVPGDELLTDARRSGIGLLARRYDLTVLGIVFTFGAFMNAFGMITPVYAFENWLGRVLHVQLQAIILGLTFFGAIVLAPVVLLGIAAYLSRQWSHLKIGILAMIVRYSRALVPLGFGMWLAHYGFHFFTGILTLIPLVQSAVASLGIHFLGDPQWTLVGLPARFVQPLEFGFILLGFAGALTVTYGLARADNEENWRLIFLPWAGLCTVLAVWAFWLMAQPMEMRSVLMS
jgi:hypothetical protein